MEIQQQMEQLRQALLYHNKKYYEDDSPEISDYEYDMLQRKLRTLEEQYPEYADENSPTRRGGGPRIGKNSSRCSTPIRWRVCRMFSPGKS